MRVEDRFDGPLFGSRGSIIRIWLFGLRVKERLLIKEEGGTIGLPGFFSLGKV